jgi:inorganic pyrophosphatase
MTNLWTEVKTGTNPPEVVYGVIESPKGSKNKFEFDKEIMAIYLDRVLYSSVVFPISYGFIPRTLGDDKDPLDIMVLITEPTFPGCVVSARPIGVLRMKDEMENDDKIIAVADTDPRLAEAQDLDWIPKHQLLEIKQFFTDYKKLEKGKKTEVLGWEDKTSAYKIINQSIKLFREKYFLIMNKKFEK